VVYKGLECVLVLPNDTTLQVHCAGAELSVPMQQSS
jgi:hypothetical protein